MKLFKKPKSKFYWYDLTHSSTHKSYCTVAFIPAAVRVQRSKSHPPKRIGRCIPRAD